MHKKIIYTTGSLANIFECYEFSVFAYLAGAVATQFFPQENMQTNLIKVFLLFSVSYFIKPLGGIFWGYVGDYHSKAAVIRWSLIMMAIPTLFIGLLPTYHQIGLLSAVLLLLLRLAQGFAMGGELPGSACYLFEISEKKDRRFHCSFISASSMLGMLLGSSLVTILHLLLTQQQMQTWGWRLPFLLGLPLALFIYQLRKNIICYSSNRSNDPAFKHRKIFHFKRLLQQHPKELLTVITLNGFIVVSYYLLFLWMPTYLIYNLHLPEKTAHLSTTFSIACLILLTLILGKFSGKFSRKFMLLSGIFTISVIALPAFHLMTHSTPAYVIYILQCLFAFALALTKSSAMETMVSLFDHKIRCLGMSFSFSISLAVFGSISPGLASYFIQKLNSQAVPVVMLWVVAISALPFVLMLDRQTKQPLSESVAPSRCRT